MTNTATISTFDADYDELARRWEAHQNLRRTGASIDELGRSRTALDEARDRLRA